MTNGVVDDVLVAVAGSVEDEDDDEDDAITLLVNVDVKADTLYTIKYLGAHRQAVLFPFDMEKTGQASHAELPMSRLNNPKLQG